MQYRFEVQHSSPRYPQSNGVIEPVVRVVKGIMEKAEESGSDPHLAMLIYRATPIRSGQLSSAQPRRDPFPAEIQSTPSYPSISASQSRDQQRGADSTETSST